jgi:hypothetical protein
MWYEFCKMEERRLEGTLACSFINTAVVNEIKDCMEKLINDCLWLGDDLGCHGPKWTAMQ